MKHWILLLMTVVAVTLLSVACNGNSSQQEEEWVAEAPMPDDYVAWDRIYRDSTNHYLLLVKWIGDTVIQFDYRVMEDLVDYQYICDTAVDKYGWLACEFIESGGSLLPAHEYLWEDSVSLGIRIGLQDDRYAQVVSSSEAWTSPLLIHEDPVAP